MIAPALADLLSACGSPAWVAAVLAAGPYADLAALVAAGHAIWLGLGPEDWKAALAAHPRIGDRPPADSQERREQAGAEGADPGVMARIAEGNARYEALFGYTYVVRASGRSAEEMLDLLEERLSHDPEEEIRVAAAQQWEITELRLARWSGSPAGS